MFGFLFKFIVLPILLVLAIAGAALAFLLLTPVDEGNVKARVWQACMVSSGIKMVDNWGRRPPRPLYSSAQCTCSGDAIVQTLSPRVAAAGAESVRNLTVQGIRRWFTGGSYAALRNSPQHRIADAFVSTSTRIARVCAGSAR